MLKSHYWALSIAKNDEFNISFDWLTHYVLQDWLTHYVPVLLLWKSTDWFLYEGNTGT